uniref:Uncharacterized protein n=1 Tax=Megaselia scalaris TaxID=36166 RepID=T1GU14_MEGSC
MCRRAIQCYKCSSYSDLNCAKSELLKSSSMANVVNCDFDRRPNYILSSAPVTKCAYMTIKDAAGVVVKRDATMKTTHKDLICAMLDQMWTLANARFAREISATLEPEWLLESLHWPPYS